MSEEYGSDDPRPDGPNCAECFEEAELAVGGLYFCCTAHRDDYFGYEVTGAGRRV